MRCGVGAEGWTFTGSPRRVSRHGTLNVGPSKGKYIRQATYHWAGSAGTDIQDPWGHRSFGALAPGDCHGPGPAPSGGQNLFAQAHRAGAVARQRPGPEPAIGRLIRFSRLGTVGQLALELQCIAQAPVRRVPEFRVRAVAGIRDQRRGPQPNGRELSGPARR